MIRGVLSVFGNRQNQFLIGLVVVILAGRWIGSAPPNVSPVGAEQSPPDSTAADTPPATNPQPSSGTIPPSTATAVPKTVTTYRASAIQDYEFLRLLAHARADELTLLATHNATDPRVWLDDYCARLTTEIEATVNRYGGRLDGSAEQYAHAQRINERMACNLAQDLLRTNTKPDAYAVGFEHLGRDVYGTP